MTTPPKVTKPVGRIPPKPKPHGKTTSTTRTVFSKKVIGQSKEQLAANVQAAQEAAKLNRVNETNPYGSRVFTTNPDGTVTATTTANADQQGLINQDTSRDTALGNQAADLQGQLANSWKNPYSLDGVSTFDPNTFNGDANRTAIEEATYNRLTRGQEDQFAKDNAAFQTQMANEGIPIDSPRYKAAFAQMQQSQNEQRLQAHSQATQQGAQELQQAWNMGMQGRQQKIGEYEAQRNSPYNELSNVLALRKGPVLPNYQGIGQVNVAAPDMMGAQLSYDQLAQQAELAKHSGGGGGGGGGGGQIWQQYGFKTPQEYDAYKTQQAQENQMWNWANNPQYRQPKGPSTGSQIGGLIGSIAKPFISSYAQSLWSH